MAFQTKLVRLSETETYLIILGRGRINVGELMRLFDEIDKATRPLTGCKVLIDFVDIDYDLSDADIDAWFANKRDCPWPEDNIVALVVARDLTALPWLPGLRGHLVELGLKFAVFADKKIAIDWLSYET